MDAVRAVNQPTLNTTPRMNPTVSSIFKFSIDMVLLSSEALLGGRSVGMEHIILVTEDVVVDVVFLGRL